MPRGKPATKTTDAPGQARGICRPLPARAGAVSSLELDGGSGLLKRHDGEGLAVDPVICRIGGTEEPGIG